MNIISTLIPGCFEIFPRIFSDPRGKLVKTFHFDTFRELGLETNFKEEYYSISQKGVLRGLHFQIPPWHHIKCVTCLSGELFDVVADLRKGSPTFGKSIAVELSAKTANMLYIPSGCAHGFYAVENNSVFLNKTTTIYNPSYEAGIRWDSLDINWPEKKPLVSEKDQLLPALHEYESPFEFL